MQEYKIILTWEAICDVTDIADYIEVKFGQQHADRFQSNLKEQLGKCLVTKINLYISRINRKGANQNSY